MDEEINAILNEIAEVKVRLARLETGQENFNELLEVLNGLLRGDRDSGTPGLKSIVYGSEALGVLPIRKAIEKTWDRIEEIAEKQDRVLLFEGRIKWLAGIFGITGLLSLISLLFALRQLFGV